MSLFVCLVALSKVVVGRQLSVSQWKRVGMDAGLNATEDDNTFICLRQGLACFTGPETALKAKVVLRTNQTNTGELRQNYTAHWKSWTTYRRMTSAKSPTLECERSFQLYVIYRSRAYTYLALLNRTSGVMAGYLDTTPSRLKGIHGYLTQHVLDSVRSTFYQLDNRGLSDLKLKPNIRSLTFRMFKRWKDTSPSSFLFWEEQLKWLLYVRQSKIDKTRSQMLFYYTVEKGTEVRIRVFKKRLQNCGVDIKSRSFYYIVYRGTQLFAVPYTIPGSTSQTSVPLKFLEHASTVTFTSGAASLLYCDHTRVYNYELHSGNTSLLFTSNYMRDCPVMYAVGTRIFTFSEKSIQEYTFNGSHLSTIHGTKTMFNVKFLKGEVTDSETHCSAS